MDGSTTWGAVHVRWAVVDDRAVVPPVLGEAQRARHDDLVGPAAARFATSRMLVADAMRTVLGPDADLRVTTVCERCGADHGRMRHAAGRVALSVAYAGELVVVAAADAREAARIGVDVERDDDTTARRIAELGPLFAPEPAPTLAGWTRIEAALKADGRGLRVAPGDVVFAEADASVVLARVPGRGGAFEVATLVGPPGYVLSAAVARRGGAAR